MIPFARVPDLIVQPESWFELGNPNLQTVCIDLAYRLPDGGCPIFTSGDDASHSPPRIIARSFEEWFLELLRQRGREYWFDPEFPRLRRPLAVAPAHVGRPPVVAQASSLPRPRREYCSDPGRTSAESP